MEAAGRSRSILELDRVDVNHGPMRVLLGVNLQVKSGEIVAVLGPNGAGKSALMRAIVGLMPISSGTIMFEGQRIDGLSTQQIFRSGLSLVPQGRLLFSSMSTFDNVRLGADASRRGKNRADIDRDLASVFSLFPVLEERKSQMVTTLSGGEQQMVAVARGLMNRPKLLLLDEPSIGLAPMLVRELMTVLGRLRSEQGISTLLAEQNADAALAIADRGYVLSKGLVALEGTSEELRATEAVKAAYLGKPTGEPDPH